MKNRKTIATSAIIYLGLVSFLAGTGCGRYEHKKEMKEIKSERAETNKVRSGLNDAVLATDSLGWDAVKDYALFKDSVTRRISLCKKNIAEFKASVKNRHGKVPVVYRRRISRLEQRSNALEQSIQQYVIKDQSSWEDFCKLFAYDLKQLEHAVEKLTHKSIGAASPTDNPHAILREISLPV